MDRSVLWKIKLAPYITIGLLIVNVVIFLLMEITGSVDSDYHIFRWGAMLTSAVSEDGEYWRLFTSMFLHFSFEHLAGNMLVLFALGTVLEKGIGHLRLALIYFIAGLGANVLSQIWSVRADEEILSAGASGAIFGLMGALVFAGLFAREWMGALSPGRIALMLLLSLYHGVNEGIDNVAHIGGLILGFLLAIILLKIFPGRYLYERRGW